MKRSPLTRKTPMARSGILRTASTQLAARAKCRHCKEPFVKRNMGHVACSPECAIALAEAKRSRDEADDAKRERKELRARREAMKSLADHLADTQRIFNAYIRERDKDLPCICCGRTVTSVTGLGAHGWDAGHYRSVGSAPHLRFDERNVHKQLVHCNRYGAGRAVDYRIGLIARIGLATVEALEAEQAIRKWTVQELKGLQVTYRQKLKDLKNA